MGTLTSSSCPLAAGLAASSSKVLSLRRSYKFGLKGAECGGSTVMPASNALVTIVSSNVKVRFLIHNWRGQSSSLHSLP